MESKTELKIRRVNGRAPFGLSKPTCQLDQANGQLRVCFPKSVAILSLGPVDEKEESSTAKMMGRLAEAAAFARGHDNEPWESLAFTILFDPSLGRVLLEGETDTACCTVCDIDYRIGLDMKMGPDSFVCQQLGQQLTFVNQMDGAMAGPFAPKVQVDRSENSKFVTLRMDDAAFPSFWFEVNIMLV